MACHFCKEPIIIRASFGQLFARMHSQTIPIIHGGDLLIFATDDDASQAAHFPLAN